MYKITMLDRIIINSITKKNSNLMMISEDTQIKRSITNEVLKDLLIKNIICLLDDQYVINPNLSKEQINAINSKDYLATEKRQLSGALIEQDLMNLEKFYLNSKDQKVFEGMLNNIKLFIEGTKKNSCSTKDETLFFWGKDNYSNIVKHTLFR